MQGGKDLSIQTFNHFVKVPCCYFARLVHGVDFRMQYSGAAQARVNSNQTLPTVVKV